MAPKRTLADDLEDDFALDNDYVSGSEDVQAVVDAPEPVKASKKRTSETPAKADNLNK
ncbi:hypothetical protein GGF41_004324, partial [Coemansia sp. RSA 2531]